MNKIETKFGTIFIEELNEQEEEDRIKIYDSNENYMSYIPIDNFMPDNMDTDDETTLKISYDCFIDAIINCDTVEDFLSILEVEYEEVFDNMKECYEYMLDWEYFDRDDSSAVKEMLKEENDINDIYLVSNELINIIGNYYIIINE